MTPIIFVMAASLTKRHHYDVGWCIFTIGTHCCNYAVLLTLKQPISPELVVDRQALNIYLHFQSSDSMAKFIGDTYDAAYILRDSDRGVHMVVSRQSHCLNWPPHSFFQTMDTTECPSIAFYNASSLFVSVCTNINGISWFCATDYSLITISSTYLSSACKLCRTPDVTLILWRQVSTNYKLQTVFEKTLLQVEIFVI